MPQDDPNQYVMVAFKISIAVYYQQKCLKVLVCLLRNFGELQEKLETERLKNETQAIGKKYGC